MSQGRLYIGNKRYSSWSLRGWLAVHLAGLEVAEVVIPFVRGPGITGTPGIRAVSPNGLVPYLEHGGARVWESLAICEYCAEQRPGLWPAAAPARAPDAGEYEQVLRNCQLGPEAVVLRAHADAATHAIDGDGGIGTGYIQCSR